MKKKILSICVLFTMVTGFSQKKWAIEVKAGANIFSNTDADDQVINSFGGLNIPSIYFKSAGKSGFMGGILGTYFLSNRFAIKSGFLYDRRGFKIKLSSYNIPYITAEGNYTANALTIPFYWQYEIGNKLKALFYAGPYTSIPLNTKISSEDVNIIARYLGTIDIGIPKVSIEIEDPDVEFGVGVGTGLIIPMNDTLDFVGDVSYKIGINRSLENSRLYDLGATVGLRYRF